jgi:chromosome segregation ATPase
MTSDPDLPPDAQQQRHPTRKWIVATVVLLAAVVGIGAYALSLRSDVDDKDAQIAAQKKQLSEQQGVAANVQDAAAALGEDARQAIGQLGDQLDEIQSQAEATQADTQAAIKSAEQAAADAKDRADGAQDEVDKANARADEAAAKTDAAAACARGYLSAIGGAFDASSISEGVDQAMSDIKTLNSSCSETIGS